MRRTCGAAPATTKRTPARRAFLAAVAAQDPVAGFAGPAFTRMIADSPTLTSCLRGLHDRREEALAEALAETTAARPDDITPRTVAALRYRGNSSAEKRKDSRHRQLAALEDHPRWRIAEDVYWAQYDAPFTLQFAKRNEAMVEIEPR